jgi:hypothetical protein
MMNQLVNRRTHETARGRLRQARNRASLWIVWPSVLVLLIASAYFALAAEVEVQAPGVKITATDQPESAEVQVPGATITVQPGQQPAPVGGTLDLSGTWKFKGDWLESGLGEGWQKPEHDDTAWRGLHVPQSWEEQGIATPNPRWPSQQPDDGYNGYAWYRKHFTVPADWVGVPLTIEFGAIDDYDWVYINGQMVGSTTSGDTWDQPRSYPIPLGLLKAGADNVIAIRVCDRGGSGGITEEPVVIRKGTAAEAAVQQPGRYTNTTREVVRIGGSVTIPDNQKVNGDVVAVGGSADISGYVTGNVVAVGGSVHARSGSWIDGDAVAVGGGIDKAEDAHIGGQTVTAVPGIGWNLDWAKLLPGRFQGPGSFFTGLLVWAFISLLAVLLFGNRLEVMADALPLHPGRAAGYGLLGFALTPAALATALVAEIFVIVVLAITIVGILAIPAVLLAMVAMVLAPGALLLIGMVGVFLSLGRALAAQLGRPDTSAAWAVLIGVLVVSIAGLIPWIGALVWLTVVIFGFGLALMTGIGSGERWSYRDMRRRGRRARRGEPEPVAEPAAPAVAPEPPQAEGPPPAEAADAPPPEAGKQTSPPEAAEPPEQQPQQQPEG